MKKVYLMAALSLAVVACERQDKPVNPPLPPSGIEQNNDNTGKNVRDRDSATKTPLDQAENETDLDITQKIRQKVIADDTLSTNAKNIKIVTINGVVTLRGPVANNQEKTKIGRKASSVQGVTQVDNLLEIAH